MVMDSRFRENDAETREMDSGLYLFLRENACILVAIL